MAQLSEIMNRDLVTVDKQASLRRARRILDQYRIRHLLVVEGKRLVGIVTDRDLRQVAPSSKSPLTISERQEFMDELKVLIVGVIQFLAFGGEGKKDIYVTLLYSMNRLDKQLGLATLCIGGGQRIAMVVAQQGLRQLDRRRASRAGGG